MKISEVYPRRFARGADLKGPTAVTIKAITQEKLHPAGRPTTKLVLWFEESPRGVILTRPLALQISDFLGDETDSWIGSQITLYPQPLNVAGSNCIAIRARPIL
jgi:hypothetical protein